MSEFEKLYANLDAEARQADPDVVAQRGALAAALGVSVPDL